VLFLKKGALGMRQKMMAKCDLRKQNERPFKYAKTPLSTWFSGVL